MATEDEDVEMIPVEIALDENVEMIPVEIALDENVEMIHGKTKSNFESSSTDTSNKLRNSDVQLVRFHRLSWQEPPMSAFAQSHCESPRTKTELISQLLASLKRYCLPCGLKDG